MIKTHVKFQKFGIKLKEELHPQANHVIVSQLKKKKKKKKRKKKKKKNKLKNYKKLKKDNGMIVPKPHIHLQTM